MSNAIAWMWSTCSSSAAACGLSKIASKGAEYNWMIAAQMGPQGARLADLAESAFIQSMDLSLLVLSIVLAVAAAFVAVWARPGRTAVSICATADLTIVRIRR